MAGPTDPLRRFPASDQDFNDWQGDVFCLLVQRAQLEDKLEDITMFVPTMVRRSRCSCSGGKQRAESGDPALFTSDVTRSLLVLLCCGRCQVLIVIHRDNSVSYIIIVRGRLSLGSKHKYKSSLPGRQFLELYRQSHLGSLSELLTKIYTAASPFQVLNRQQSSYISAGMH